MNLQRRTNVLYVVDKKVVEVNDTKVPVVLDHMLVKRTAVVVPLVARTAVLVWLQMRVFHVPLHVRALLDAPATQLANKCTILLQNLGAHQRIGID